MRESPRRILLVLVAGIGDFVLATPALGAIRRAFPGAHLALLTTPQAGVLAAPCPHFQEVYTFDLRAYRPGERGTGLRGSRRLLEAVRVLRSRRFDLAVDLYAVETLAGAARMWLLLAGVNARETAGRWSAGRGRIFDRRGPDLPHEADSMLALSSLLGGRADHAAPALWTPEASRATVALRLGAVGLFPGAPYCVLAVGSNRPEARLPDARAVEIGCALYRATGLPILVTGDRGERAAVEELVGRIGAGSHNLAGEIDLHGLAALLEGARLVISTDSGPMHMAAAISTPLVALYGPSDPRRFGPRGNPARITVLQGRVAPHDPHRWHTDITTSQVVDAAKAQLARSHPPENVAGMNPSCSGGL